MTRLTFSEPVPADVPVGPRASRSRRGLLLAMSAVAVLATLVAIGLWPRFIQSRRVTAATTSANPARPRVPIVIVRPGDASLALQLPGSVEAVIEVPIHARADGYVQRRLVDIGDRVRAGDLLAEIDSPELAEQSRQADAAERRAGAAVRQAQAALDHSRVNLELAEVTMRRWDTLVARGVLSEQDGDEKRTAYRARQTEVSAGEAAVTAAREAVNGAASDRRRLSELQRFRQIRAPFNGIVTVRNTEVGALVSPGSGTSVTPLFRVAALDRVRVHASVPQSEASAVRVGVPCEVTIRDLPGRTFPGRIARTASALDPASRTLLIEIDMAGADGALVPGMSATVHMALHRDNPPPVIPVGAYRTGDGGPRVAVVDAQGTVRFRSVRLGRDDGTQVEVLEGLAPGERIAMTISDDVREGAVVEPVAARPSGAAPAGPAK